MIPVKDAVRVNFGGGLDLKTDPKQIDASEFLALNNMAFTTGGRLNKRNGFAGGFTKTVNTPNPSLTYSAVPATLTSATKAFSYNNELLVNDSWNLYSWDASNFAWNYKGRSTRVSLETQSVIANGALTFHSCDCSIDVTSGIKVFAASADDGDAHTYYSIQDIATGQLIVNQALFGSYNFVRCVSISGKSWVFGVNASNGHIDYQAIVGQTVTGSPTALITDLNSTHQFYDVDVDAHTGNIYIAYYTTGPSIKISALSTSLVVGNSITEIGEHASNGLSWFGDGSNIWVVYNNATATKAFIVNNAVTTTVLAPTTVDGSASDCNNVTGCWSSTQSKAFIFYDAITLSGGANSPVTAAIITHNTLTVGGVAGTAVLFAGSVAINSKAWAINGIPHLMGLYSLDNVQATNFLLNLYNVTPTMGGSTNNDVIANVAGKVSPDEAAQVCWAGGENGGSGSLPGAKQNSSGYWELAALQNNNYGTESVYYIAPTAVMDVQFNFSPLNPDVQSLGNNAAIAGASVLNYDGATLSEQNFHIYPDVTAYSVTTGVSGSAWDVTVDSLYGYIFTYEWIDNQGQVHRSFPSPVLSPVASGHSYTFAASSTQCQATLTIPTLRVTNKSGSQVVINVYRTIANGSVYFLVSSFGTVINDPSVANVTFIDETPDDLITGNIQIYTTGALGYFAPPASAAITNFKNRAVYVSSEDPYQIGYSNAVLQNFPVQFVPEFILNIGTVGGALTTVAQMDDKMIFFKSGKISGPAIYYMVGQGPAPSGASNDFQDPLPIAVDVGNVDRPSVVLTPVGLMFKSDKGIYLIDRSLQASYIGAPVEGYNQYSVLSAQLIPNSTQVRFWISNGTLLMYDYFFKKWSTWTPPAGISDCIFQGQHTYVDATGQVYQETPGLFVDGASTPVLMSFTTAWIKLAGLVGYQRAYFFFLLAQYISSHKLSLSLYTDFSTTPDSTVTITPNSQDSLENWRIFFAKQRCQSFQIQLSEVYTGVLGQGFNMSGLNLIVGAKNKFRTISAAQSVG